MKTHFIEFVKQRREHFSLLLFYYFLVSVGGFLWEVLIFLVMEGTFRKRGFFYGPWVPIYGLGAVWIEVFVPWFLAGHGHGCRGRLLKTFTLSAVSGAALELLVGFMLHRFWNLRYWDYRSYFLNFRGYICFWSVLGFGLAGTLWHCFLAEKCAGIWLRIPAKFRHNILTLLLFLFLLDFAAALILPNQGQGITFP